MLLNEVVVGNDGCGRSIDPILQFVLFVPSAPTFVVGCFFLLFCPVSFRVVRWFYVYARRVVLVSIIISSFIVGLFAVNLVQGVVG